MPRNDLERLDQIIAEASPKCSRTCEPANIARRLRQENLSLGITLGSVEGTAIFQFNEDRFRHTAVVGRTGSGKSNHVLQMEREDIRSGAGVAIIAAHEEDALYPLMCVPDERIDDVVIIDPTNARMLPNMNPLDVDRNDRAAVSKAVADCLKLLKSQCHYDWAGPRFDQMARLGLETMLSPSFPTEPYSGLPCEPHIALVERMFTDSGYVRSFMRRLTDKHLYDQWALEARTRASREADDKVQWFLCKFDPFCSDRVLKNVFGPGKKTVDIKRIVDEGKILIAIIPEHRIGHDAAHMLRTWILMQLKDAILQRGFDADGGYYGICTKQKEQRELDPFFVYVDEFAEHASQVFASFLSESRKYRVGFTLAFQNLSQMRVFDVSTGYENDKLLNSIFGNVGTMICYPIGSSDVPSMARQLDVEERKVSGIKRYRPLARVCIDNDPTLLTLEVPQKTGPRRPGHAGAAGREPNHQQHLAARQLLKKGFNMSFRPTISIYLNKHIVDCGYYRNWGERDIMLECCRLAKLLDGSKSIRDVMERLGRTSGIEEWEQGKDHEYIMPNPYHDEVKKQYMSKFCERLRPLSAPASFCADEAIPQGIEAGSEFPAFIDLTDRCIYWNRNGFISHPAGEPIRSIRDYEDAYQYCAGWLHGGRISFDLIPYIERKLGGSHLDGFAHAEKAEKFIGLVANTLIGGLNRSA